MGNWLGCVLLLRLPVCVCGAGSFTVVWDVNFCGFVVHDCFFVDTYLCYVSLLGAVVAKFIENSLLGSLEVLQHVHSNRVLQGG